MPNCVDRTSGLGEGAEEICMINSRKRFAVLVLGREGLEPGEAGVHRGLITQGLGIHMCQSLPLAGELGHL